MSSSHLGALTYTTLGHFKGFHRVFNKKKNESNHRIEVPRMYTGKWCKIVAIWCVIGIEVIFDSFDGCL